MTPLHCLCGNESANDEMLRTVGGFWPDAAKEKDEEYGATPLHYLCMNESASDRDRNKRPK